MTKVVVSFFVIKTLRPCYSTIGDFNNNWSLIWNKFSKSIHKHSKWGFIYCIINEYYQKVYISNLNCHYLAAVNMISGWRLPEVIKLAIQCPSPQYLTSTQVSCEQHSDKYYQNKNVEIHKIGAQIKIESL